MSDIRFKSSLSIEEIENNFKDITNSIRVQK